MSAVRFADITPEAVMVTIDVAEVLRTAGDAQLRAECERRGLVPPGGEVPLTGVHVRGARGLLDWTVGRLAEAAGVSASTVNRFEDGGEGPVRPGKVAAMRRALEAGGAVFRAVDGALCIGWTASTTASADGRGRPA